MKLIKALTRKAARKLGYQIHKYPSGEFLPISVFDLSVQFLMAVRGKDLNFIQVGANDGEYGDPLRKYILNFPWRGVLVEPQPDVFAKLKKNYEAIKDRLIFENVAIAKGVSSITMYKAPGNHDTHQSSVVSTDPKQIGLQLGLRSQQLERFLVPCTSLNNLIKKYRMSQIDVLQIDAEGCDYDIIRDLDFSEISPLIIQFEHGGLAPRDVTRAVDCLDSHGYHVLYGGYQIDTIALHKSFPRLID
jgi:FkbM family methyltransferase